MIALALARFLARTPWSSAMALIGMTLGVVSIVSVHLISASISSRLDGLVPAQLSGFSHFLHHPQTTADDYFELRRSWRRGELPGLQGLAPLIDETTDINGQGVRVIGVDLFNRDLVPEAASGADAESDTDRFSWSGVWIDQSLEGKLEYPVNGIVSAPAGTLIADIGIAQEILGWNPDQLSYLGLQIENPYRKTINLLEHLLPGFGAGFPSIEPDVPIPAGWQVVSIAEQHPAREFGKSVLFNISALGLLALLVAWLLIYQVSVSWLRRLWPVFERLHVLGTDWQLLRRYFLSGLVVLAVLSSGMGILLGWALAQWLLDVAMPVGSVDLQLDRFVVIKAAGSSLAVCVLGGLFAFHRAEQIPGVKQLALVMSVIMLCLAMVGLFVPATGLAGGFFSIAVLSLVTGFLVSPLLRRFRRFSRWIRGPYLARLSLREALWYPEDVGVALAGLILAISTAIGVGLMVESFRTDFDAMLERRLDYDLVAEGEHQSLASLRSALAGDPRVSRMQVYRDTEIRVQGMPMSLRVARVDLEEAQRYGNFPALGAQQVLLSEQAARVLEAGPGDVVVAQGQRLEVTGVFSGFGEVLPRLIVDDQQALADRATEFDSIGLKSPQPDALLASIRSGFPDLQLRLQTDIREAALDTFDQTFAITSVLIAIALLVATISIYIAITAMRLNRVTGSRLLVTLGISRWEAAGMDFALGVGIGLVALLIALPLGTVFGWILCSVINPRAFGWTIELQLTANALLQPLLLGMAAAVIAGVFRGGRTEEGFAHAQR